MTEEKKIHPTHFQVPEMPWREKEKQAILLLQKILVLHGEDAETKSIWIEIARLIHGQQDLVDWVMKYKGE